MPEMPMKQAFVPRYILQWPLKRGGLCRTFPKVIAQYRHVCTTKSRPSTLGVPASTTVLLTFGLICVDMCMSGLLELKTMCKISVT